VPVPEFKAAEINASVPKKFRRLEKINWKASCQLYAALSGIILSIIFSEWGFLKMILLYQSLGPIRGHAFARPSKIRAVELASRPFELPFA